MKRFRSRKEVVSCGIVISYHNGRERKGKGSVGMRLTQSLFSLYADQAFYSIKPRRVPTSHTN
jgi:hypothetical protein